MFALVRDSDGMVVQTTEAAFAVHSGFSWVAAPAQVTAYEYRYVGGEFVHEQPPTAPPSRPMSRRIFNALKAKRILTDDDIA